MEPASQIEFRTDKTGGVRVLCIAGSVTIETSMDLSGLQLPHSVRPTVSRW